LLVVATATPAARQAFSLAQLKSYRKANGFIRRHALQQEQLSGGRRVVARRPVPRAFTPHDCSKNPACPTFKLWQSRARNGDNMAQVLVAKVRATKGSSEDVET
jgi:hypothetical protein